MFGDLGEAVFRHSATDSLRWALGASSRDYALGKITAISDGDKKVFSWGAMAALDGETLDLQRNLADADDEEQRAHLLTQLAIVARIHDDMTAVEYDHPSDQQREWYESWATHRRLGASDVDPCLAWSATAQWIASSRGAASTSPQRRSTRNL